MMRVFALPHPLPPPRGAGRGHDALLVRAPRCDARTSKQNPPLLWGAGAGGEGNDCETMHHTRARGLLTLNATMYSTSSCSPNFTKLLLTPVIYSGGDKELKQNRP